jgi:hypothetical protein
MNRERKRLIDRLESSAEDLYSYLGKFSEQELQTSRRERVVDSRDHFICGQ